MTNNYIDPITELTNDKGEIFSDRNLKITGIARLDPTNSTEVVTSSVKILCSPINGGSQAVTTIPDTTYILPNPGDTYWVEINRLAGEVAAIPSITLVKYTAGNQPKNSRNWLQLFYNEGGRIIAAYPLLQASLYDAIVGDFADAGTTHSLLQTAIDDVISGTIYVRKMCTGNFTTGNAIKFVFAGSDSGIEAITPGTGTGMVLAAGCQMVGFGKIYNYEYGVQLGGGVLPPAVGCRIEMVFDTITTPINYNILTSEDVNYQGSYGMDDNAHIETSDTDHQVCRWNAATKRWEPTNVLIDNSGTTTTLTAPIVIGAVYQ